MQAVMHADGDESCPICYIDYGAQPDGSFLCRDGLINSDCGTVACKHFCCVSCLQKMRNLMNDDAACNTTKCTP